MTSPKPMAVTKDSAVWCECGAELVDVVVLDVPCAMCVESKCPKCDGPIECIDVVRQLFRRKEGTA